VVLRRRKRNAALRADRTTVALGALAAGAFAAVAGIEFSRVWRRGSAPLPAESDSAVLAALDAASETAEVAVAGYRDVSTRENAMFNLLTSFVTALLLARGIALGLQTRATFGPFRDVKVGRRHIHHFIPGMVMVFTSGAAAIVTRNEDVEPWLAVPFGAGMGLVLDESALLLELDDVYWSEEGVVGVQISLAAIAMLASIALATRFLRRGEAVVLEAPPVAAPQGD
jgi:hypothetical protein